MAVGGKWAWDCSVNSSFTGECHSAPSAAPQCAELVLVLTPSSPITTTKLASALYVRSRAPTASLPPPTVEPRRSKITNSVVKSMKFKAKFSRKRMESH